MARQLFRLRGVPDDEADEVRQLLTDADIDFYETPPGNWGVGMPAIWLRDKDDYERARAMIDAYQEQRAATARADRARLKREGKERSLLDEIREDPIRFIVYAGIALVVLYLSTKPFLDFGG